MTGTSFGTEMAHAKDQVSVADGQITLYRRDDVKDPTWQCRIRVKGHRGYNNDLIIFVVHLALEIFVSPNKFQIRFMADIRKADSDNDLKRRGAKSAPQ
jgi:hypothetical protein